ncbi:unnamed protein product [Fraxinus pennsylvanica]|uniref:Uncharacterized protein n=1 Tax=Fraxinus pennsylvanica TaxID=56036 RepID=A0AAD2E4X2_9LAMI|nr:unnamed protein product [Fraxinus pennsylvanica]
MESPTPVSRYIPQNSKKRVFQCGSSSGCQEADVVEIPTPINRSSKAKLLKQKEVTTLETLRMTRRQGLDLSRRRQLMPLQYSKNLRPGGGEATKLCPLCWKMNMTRRN